MGNQETRQCQNCKQDFIIEPDDFDFYEKMKVPAPTFCPECRLQRRLAWKNERSLYKVDCNLCGATVFAMHSKDAPFPIYCMDCWESDKWNAVSYGREYNFLKHFFAQLHDLYNKVPHKSLIT
ncbi:MAG: hypothetical protein NT094_03350 [Candidatus Staskawiczbacteria bacterium]|nr:hypothetical protein [Candidatus Staskawiczbacteria bacterium]